ncbi:SDR family NAD(P)-dependent oxidoreductase [Mycobacterium sp. E1747]|uniref:SDR family NAD(P)-dependent oxidoreductase n=1 Tax=Mycobacterium sp. E1747 TaxID=1834128 RepID=UPI0007FFDC08|nr:SDR family oxidoreductase [Mycobacterium sp. E1747]OBH12767.1 oxidoreductase [Mycobacterium sp. E1747]
MSDRPLAGRVALVTGGSRGLGAGISRRLAADGAAVALSYRRDREAAAEVVEEIRGRGGVAHGYCAPVDDVDAVMEMVAAVRLDIGPPDIVVSNAGIASRGLSVKDADPAEFHRLMNVHAFAPARLLQSLLPDMRRAGRSDVVLISSVATDGYPAMSAPYTMAKAALEALGHTLAREEREYGVRVNIVAPGLLDTPMGEKLVRAVRTDQTLQDLHSSYPFGRVCQPEDVANVVAFLCSPLNGYMTGQRITVDGGGHAPPLA